MTRPHNVRRLQRLIDRVYDASMDDASWLGIAEEISQVFCSTSAVLKVQDTEEQVQLLDTTANLIVSGRQQDWAEHWHRNDLWVERSLAHGMSKIITSRDLMPDREFETTEFYCDWIRHLDIYHMIGAVFPVDERTVGIVGIHRPDRSRAYQDVDRRNLAAFLPHLQRALRLRQRFSQVQRGTADAFNALEQSHSAVLIVDDQMHVLFASPLAERMLSDAKVLAVKYGKLELRQSGASGKLGPLVKGCVRTASGTASASGDALILRRPGRLPLTLSVAPLRPTSAGSAPSRPAALIFIRDPETLAVCAEKLQQLFGFTRAEAAVAEALAEGHSLGSIAESHTISIGTVRSHLKKILSKTNTGKQSELVSLMLRSAAGLLP